MVSCLTGKIYNSVLELNVLPELITSAPNDQPIGEIPISGGTFMVEFSDGIQSKNIDLLSAEPLNQIPVVLMYLFTFTGVICSDVPYLPDYNLGFMPNTINIISNSLNYSYRIEYVGDYVPNKTYSLCSGKAVQINADSNGNFTNIENQLVITNQSGTPEPFTPIMLVIILE